MSMDSEARFAGRPSFDRAFFAQDDEGGYTTLGMVVALLVSLSLVFAGAQVYRVNSASAAIQDVADASALAAENQVGQFMVVVRVCDALVLSLSLTSIAATGLGVAALCTPVTAEASTALLKAGRTIGKARDTFSRGSTKVLTALQRALPFLAAASAWDVARRNNDTSASSNYLALAMLVPSTGEVEGVSESKELEEAQDAADEEADDIKSKASDAEESAKEAKEAKHRAFMADCGSAPGYCMYERAERLAGLTGSANPLYTHEEVWTFTVALNRAQQYYMQRYENESPDEWTVAGRARSVLRKNVYRYAVQLMASGYVRETDTSFDAYFPLLPRNTSEMRETSLYDEAAYPVTVDEDGVATMHAFDGCPNAASGYEYLGSVRDLEAGDYETCPECSFTASSLGSVCSASTSISNGFEYHYRIVADAAEDYEKARSGMDATSSEVKQKAESLFDRLKKALNAAKEARISAEPAGRYGVIVMVVDVSSVAANGGLGGSFIQTDATLGTRAAVSGATLLADASDGQGSVITQVLDGVRDKGGVATGVLSAVLECWSSFLYAYSSGQDAISDGIKNAVNMIPFASESGLGKWASKKFTQAMEETGLQAAELDALKPVIVNTGYVAQEDSGGFSVSYLVVKRSAEALFGSDRLFSTAVSEAEAQIVSTLSGDIEIATIQPLGDWGPSIPITITLPPATQEASTDLVRQIAERIQGILPSTKEEGAWR